MADAEIFHIRHQFHDTVKRHAVAELNTVGRGRDHNDASPSAKRTTILFGGNISFTSGQLKSVSPASAGTSTALLPVLNARDNVPVGNRQLTAIMPGAVLMILPSTVTPFRSNGTI